MDGKVSLPPLPEPPYLLKELLSSNCERSLIFKKYIRQINNALSMASIKSGSAAVHTGGYQPTVFIQVNITCILHNLYFVITNRLKFELIFRGNRTNFSVLFVHPMACRSTHSYTFMIRLMMRRRQGLDWLS